MEPNILFFVVGLKQVSERFPLVANYFPAGEAPYWDDHIRRKKGKMGGPPSHLPQPRPCLGEERGKEEPVESSSGSKEKL